MAAIVLFTAFGMAPGLLRAQTPMDAFHWIDFHDPKDAPTVAWVTQQLKTEKWSQIREIGAQWDAAIVITSQRETPQSSPTTDTYTVWSVSLAKHEVQPLLKGVKLRILDWTTFGGSMMPEVGLIYNDCQVCDASTFFTTVHYSNPDHAWRARWMRGNEGASLYSAGNVDGVKRTQIYALLTGPEGREILGTWTHFDYGKVKPAEDYLFEYSVDTASGLEQTQGLSGKHADEMMAHICQAGIQATGDAAVDPAHAELTYGQDSELCGGVAKVKAKPVRRPVTTPPANNRGQSEPPGSRSRPAVSPPAAAKPEAKKANP